MPDQDRLTQAFRANDPTLIEEPGATRRRWRDLKQEGTQPMTNRYMLNETVCPIPLEQLALLLRSDEVRIGEIVEQFPMLQRASLAAFCFSKCHMRSLGFEIASRCEEWSLRTAAGTAGETLFQQSRNRIAFDAELMHSRKAKVTLARVA